MPHCENTGRPLDYEYQSSEGSDDSRDSLEVAPACGEIAKGKTS